MPLATRAQLSFKYFGPERKVVTGVGKAPAYRVRRDHDYIVKRHEQSRRNPARYQIIWTKGAGHVGNKHSIRRKALVNRQVERLRIQRRRLEAVSSRWGGSDQAVFHVVVGKEVLGVVNHDGAV